MAKAKSQDGFPIQEMSIKALRADLRIQSRASMSVEDQRAFSEAMLRGDEFPPITVFFDGSVYWIADGFHRHAAASAAGFASIRAEIRPGSERDALIYSAGANKRFSIPRTKEDIKKAVFMLLGDDEWFDMSSLAIAKHVGVGAETVTRHRAEYCSARGLPVPTIVKRSDGAQTPAVYVRSYARKKPVAPLPAASGDDRLAHVAATQVTNTSGVCAWLIKRGVFAAPASLSTRLHAITGVRGQTWVASLSAFASPNDFSCCIGTALLLRQLHKADAAFAICNPSEVPGSHRELAESLGVRIVKLEELIEIFRPAAFEQKSG